MLTRKPVLAALAAFLVLALFPAAGFAADPAHPEPAAAGHAEPAAGAKPAEPNVFDLPARWDLSIYTLVVFVLLFFILARFAWPAIMQGMRAREQGIIDARDQAIAAQREAEAIRTDLQARLAKAHDDVRALLEEARKDAEKLRATERERATREINAARDAALQEIYQKSVQLASLMSSKAIRRELTPADHSRLVDESLAELAGKPGVN